MKKIGVSAETFSKWKYIKKRAVEAIPADKLAIIACFLTFVLKKFSIMQCPRLPVTN